MSLVTLATALKHADEHGYAIGAFNTLSIEAIRGALRAAEELRSPIILQVASVQFDIVPLELIGPAMIDAGKRATVPVVVNLDHGEELEDIEAALALGFTSVMFDGAKLPLEQNMAKSRLVKEMAHMAGASCEAELGVVGGGEDGSDTIEMRLTDVNQVKTFIEGTGVDALAVAIGNAHGPYVKEPDIRLDRLAEINAITDVPLVLHGGSGISESDFKIAIEKGIQKINVATALQVQVVQDVAKLYEDKKNKPNYNELYETIEETICTAVKAHMTIFMSPGNAW
jgi:fructose-bisphosphate aldolase class II